MFALGRPLKYLLDKVIQSRPVFDKILGLLFWPTLAYA